MTALGRRDARFFDITRLRQVGARYFAMAGLRQTVIAASYSSGLVSALGETADLGSEARDAVGNASALAILTGSGLRVATLADTPVVTHSTDFDPGDGNWILSLNSRIIAPIHGGVQVFNSVGVQVSQTFPGSMRSGVEAALTDDGVLVVADQDSAKLHIFDLDGDRVSYVDSVRAPNCRDVVKMTVADGVLFVLCRHRLLSFDVDGFDVTLRHAYDKGSVEYTDFVAVPGGFWVGIDADTALNPIRGRFNGPQYALFDEDAGTNGSLIVACPQVSLFAASNVIPYLEEGDLVLITDPEQIEDPPVVAPSAPVITSDLTSSALAGVPWTYTATATGDGPVSFGVTAPPVWLTVNPFTGAISGTPPSSAVVNIEITATNAGGTDTSTLVLTVLAIANLGAVTVDDGDVRSVRSSGTLLYIGGTFSTVSDANGSYSRVRLACLDLISGLWTTWDPGCTGTVFAIEPLGDYIFIGTSAATLGGIAVTGLGRVHKTTGIADAGFVPALAGGANEVYALLADVSANSLYVGGSFTTYDGNGRESGIAKITALSLTGWYPTNSGDRATQGDIRSIVDAGTSVLWGGHSNVRITDTVHNKVFSFGRSAKSSGTTPTYTWGGYNTFQVDAVAADGGRDYIGGIFVGFDKIYDSSDFVNRINLGAIDGAGSVAGFTPDPASQVKALYVNPTTGNIFVGTDKVRQYDSSGSSAATPTWTGGTGINALARIGPALAIGGSYLTAVINGASRTRLALMNIATGVVY